jgi:transcriptional regulator with XRE-family HTH domain
MLDKYEKLIYNEVKYEKLIPEGGNKMSIVATNIRRILNERCIKQSQFAKRYGFAVKTFNGMLHGRSPLKESHIIMIANALAVKPAELFRGYEEMVVREAIKTTERRDT